MKNYIAFNTTNANWWDGKTFHAENPPLLITALQLAVLRATYENVVGTEVVSLPTVTEAESWENQEIDLDGGLSAINE